MRTIIETARGCGYRKPGGYYLMGSAEAAACCKLPFPLTACPCCGHELKFSRGFRWIDSAVFCPAFDSDLLSCNALTGCIIAAPGRRMGISKRVPRIPKGVAVGTWIALAHLAGLQMPPLPEDHGVSYYKPAVICVFRVTALQYVAAGNESPEFLQELTDAGIEPVKVIPDNKTQISLL